MRLFSVSGLCVVWLYGEEERRAQSARHGLIVTWRGGAGRSKTATAHRGVCFVLQRFRRSQTGEAGRVRGGEGGCGFGVAQFFRHGVTQVVFVYGAQREFGRFLR